MAAREMARSAASLERRRALSAAIEAAELGKMGVRVVVGQIGTVVVRIVVGHASIKLYCRILELNFTILSFPPIFLAI